MSLTTRLAMAKSALVSLVEEYFRQSNDVEIRFVTFDDASTYVGTFTNSVAAINAINAVTDGGATDYRSAVNRLRANWPYPPDGTRQNYVYFLSDGVPTDGNTTNPITANYDPAGGDPNQSYEQWAAGIATGASAYSVKSYGVAIGTGVTNFTHLDAVHNVDSLGDGVRDGAIVVPDLNDLASQLLSTVPQGVGGNVVSTGIQNSLFGADDGIVSTITVKLDTDSNGTPDTDVTFTYNPAGSGTITSSIAITGLPATGSPALTLNSSKNFPYGTLVFDFSSGDYTYFTGGSATQGTSFTVSATIIDNDGDTVTSLQTINVVDGTPIARADTDTLVANDQFLEGNVITGLGTDAGLAVGAQVTPFTVQGSGVDTVVDGAKVDSIVFKGQTISLAADSSGSVGGGTYSVTASTGRLTWTHASNGSSLEFDNTGYYKYTPPTAAVPSHAAVTSYSDVNFFAAPPTMTGVSLSGSAAVGYSATNGAGIGTTLDAGEYLQIDFGNSQYPSGVSGVTIDIAAASGLTNSGSASGANRLTYTVYNTSGGTIGSFNWDGEGSINIDTRLGFAATGVGAIRITGVGTPAAYVAGVQYASGSTGAVEFSNEPNATSGVILAGMAATATTSSTTTDAYSSGTGAGVSGGSNASNIDDLESLVISFDTTKYANGVQNVKFNIDATNSNLATGNAITYRIYAVDGVFLGQFASSTKATSCRPPTRTSVASRSWPATRSMRASGP